MPGVLVVVCCGSLFRGSQLQEMKAEMWRHELEEALELIYR